MQNTFSLPISMHNPVNQVTQALFLVGTVSQEEWGKDGGLMPCTVVGVYNIG